MILHVFLSLTGVRETVLSHLWRSGSTLGEKIKPWLFVPGFQFCIPVSCAEGMLWWDKWHWLVIKDNILHLSEWSLSVLYHCAAVKTLDSNRLFAIAITFYHLSYLHLKRFVTWYLEAVDARMIQSWHWRIYCCAKHHLQWKMHDPKYDPKDFYSILRSVSSLNTLSATCLFVCWIMLILESTF